MFRAGVARAIAGFLVSIGIEVLPADLTGEPTRRRVSRRGRDSGSGVDRDGRRSAP